MPRKPKKKCVAVKVALDPTPRQVGLLRSHAGGARVAYNAMLAHIKEQLDRGEKPMWSQYELRRWWNGVKDSLAPWWAENSKEAYSYAAECLANGLRNWSDSKHGKRKGRKVGFPRFKSRRGSRAAFAYTTGTMGLVKGDPRAVKLPCIGRVHCFEDVEARVAGRKVLRVTVSEHGGRWFASLTVEEPPMSDPVAPPGGGVVGVDVGVKTLATLSDGTVIPNGKPLKRNMRRLKNAQHHMSKMEKGSKRREKQRHRIARLHKRVADLRADNMHKLTTWLSATFTEIHIESLNVQGMERNHNLAGAVADAAFYEFARQMDYKCRRTGAKLVPADRWYPSSKKCSNCGSVKAKLALGERTYVCDECGYAIDRDLNAAINLKNWNPSDDSSDGNRNVAESASETLNARGGNTRREAPRPNAVPGETRTKQSDSSGVRLGAGLSNQAM